ncbi:hypothetical protein CAL26_23615 [Bordetella genomosp. 9]|uniref:Uncharacterized protein n=1 Tax=Bordetella genomosp. 9 TaxID=1416803 RepID=A0A261R629_9BORD|nr:hypothetical protein [Bordetella genomosp. 9]OZI20486.1 hypothetical protein CAL26_23615 [Bordetella genomosp. 9]
MSSIDFEAYERFAIRYKARFAGISRATDGEHTPEDVASEALLLAVEMAQKVGATPDFDDSEFQDRLIRHLHQHLVKYTETVVRHAVRLDKPIDGEEVSAEDHPAMRHRADMGNDPAEPLAQLLEKEVAAVPLDTVTPHESRAAAYIHLLDRCGSSMRIAADALKISLSYCYFRFNEAKRLVTLQADLKPIVGDPAFAPGPWRPYKMIVDRPWQQLTLDFDDMDLAW